jgi:hypothetical protein
MPDNKEDKAKKWKNRVNWAIDCSRRRRERWKKAECLYLAQLDDSTDSEDSNDTRALIRVPLLYSVFATVLPTIFSTMPVVKAVPKADKDEEKSDLVESVVENIYEETKIYEELRSVVLSSIIKGTGFLKIGFKADFKKVPRDEDDIIQAFETSGQDSFDDFKRVESNLWEEIIDNEGVWVKYLENDKLFLDPEGKDLESCNFIAHQVFMQKEDFEKKYPSAKIGDNFFVEAITDEKNKSLCESDKLNVSAFTDSSDGKRVKVFEVWSKKDNKVVTFAEGHDELLDEQDWPYTELRTYPFEVLSLSPKLDSIYGVEVLLMLEDANRVHNEMVDSQEDNAQRSNSGILITEDAMDDDEIERYREPGSNKVVTTKDINLIRPFTSPPNSPETYQVLADMRRIIEETAHINAQTRQTSAPGKQTATEIEATAAAGGVLNFFKIREIERLVERTTEKVIALVKQFYDQPRTAKIDSRLGVPAEWVEWRGRDLGDHSFTVKAGSAAHQDTAIKLQQKMQFLGQTMQLIQLIPNPQPIVQALYEEIGDLHGINKEIIDQAFQPQQPVQGALIPGAQPPEGGAQPPEVAAPETAAVGNGTPNIAAPQINI